MFRTEPRQASSAYVMIAILMCGSFTVVCGWQDTSAYPCLPDDLG